MQQRLWPWLFLGLAWICLCYSVSCGDTLVSQEPVESDTKQEKAWEKPGQEASVATSEEPLQEPVFTEEIMPQEESPHDRISDGSSSDLSENTEPKVEPVQEVQVTETVGETVPEPSLPQSYVLEGGVTVSLSQQQVTITYQGIFRSRKNLTVHYGFDGWNVVQGRTQTQQNDGTDNDDFYQQQGMTPIPASQGQGFQTTLDIPQKAKVLHLVFFTENNQAREWDNNQGRDFHVELWFPYIGPYLTWNEKTPPSSGVVVSFVSSPACVGRVDYGTNPALGMQVVESQSQSYHRIPLSGLQPETQYHYKVSCADGRQSPVYTFRTGALNPSQVKFAAMADMQDNGETGRWGATVQEILTHHQDLDFLIIPGDLPWNDRPGLWWTFFDKARTLFATKVMMPVPGNHDTPTVSTNPDTSSFLNFFALPTTSGSATYYSFRYGSALFLGLNSEWPEQIADKTGKQYLWMQQMLGQLPTLSPTWVFAYWHHPPYNTGNRHWGEQGTFREITSMFDGKVDWVFCGHEHLYQRMKPMRYNASLVAGGYGLQATQGVGYLVLPPAGAWPNETLIDSASDKAHYRDRLAYPVPTPGQNRVPSENGFVRVDVVGRSITLKTYGLGSPTQPQTARVIDQVSYTKSP